MDLAIRARAVLAAAWVLVGCEAPVVTPIPAVHVTADIRQCPLITEVSVLPLEVIVGGEIEVSANASDETFDSVWSAGAGSFEDPTARSTLYFCDVPGSHTIRFTISDPPCMDLEEVTVTCSYSPFCGDGRIDFGEDCDDGNTAPNDGCSSHCRTMEIEGVE